MWLRKGSKKNGKLSTLRTDKTQNTQNTQSSQKPRQLTRQSIWQLTRQSTRQLRRPLGQLSQNSTAQAAGWVIIQKEAFGQAAEWSVVGKTLRWERSTSGGSSGNRSNLNEFPSYPKSWYPSRYMRKFLANLWMWYVKCNRVKPQSKPQLRAVRCKKTHCPYEYKVFIGSAMHWCWILILPSFIHTLCIHRNIWGLDPR